jgi:hypothetical protein
MMAAVDLVKRCPACGTQSPPAALRCRCGTLLAHVDLTPPAQQDPAPAVDAAAPEAPPRVCSHVDCAQPNAADATRCVYCDRPFGEAPIRLISARIEWPWGDCTAVATETLIGRAPPADPALVDRLERDFDNVSRRHAILRFSDGAVTLEDLGSSNGTFVNGVKLPPNQPIRLHDGARIRFAADLTAIFRSHHG